MKIERFFYLGMVMLFISSCMQINATFEGANLKVEDSINPLGVLGSSLKFSWQIKSETPQVQQAFQICIAKSTHESDNIFKTGFVNSAQNFYSVNVKDLKSSKKYWWKIRIKNEAGELSNWSEPEWFVTGIQKDSEWQAKLIGGDSINMVRKEFTVDHKIKEAYAFASSSGLYELHLNGQKVGDRVLEPAQTNTHKRLIYASYDVTELLKSGENALGLCIGGGAYAHLYKSADRYALVQLNIIYDDGSSEIICTDSTWKATAQGPRTYTGLYEGESYDARREMKGWDMPNFDSSSWRECIVKNPVKLYPQLQAIKEAEVVKPITVKASPNDEAYIFDLGKNITGYPQISVEGEAGTKITMRTSEILNPDGSINYWTSGREWKLEYTLKGDGVEVWKPRFTNTGFRYVEVTGYPGKPKLENIQGILTYSDLKQAGTFDCSNSIINKIHDAYVLSQVGNLMGFPTDCPHRERLGWLGDALQIGVSSSYNFDMQYFYKKWFRDMNDDLQPDGSVHQLIPFPNFGDEQDPVWQSASIIMPWEMYWFYGDTTFLSEGFHRMDRMMDYYESLSKDFIIQKNRWGDWVRPIKEENTNGAYLSTTYYFKCADIMAKAAAVLGKSEDAKKYKTLSENIKDAINKEWFKGDHYAENTQTANSIALDFGIVSDENVKVVLHELLVDIKEHDYHITTGVVGQMPLISTLHKYSYNDIIFKMITQTSYPSLGHMIQKGATTFWERYYWGTGSYDSHNHVFLGGPYAKWFYDGLAGISPLEPGFKTISIQPQILLDEVSALVNTINGKVECNWQNKNNSLNLNVTVPQNTSAVLEIPTLGKALSDIQIYESDILIWAKGKFIKKDRIDFLNAAKNVRVNLKPGKYQFEIKN